MKERTAKVLGALSALGGLLAAVATVPSRWYGVPDTDAYVFDPAVLTPLWIERTVIPAVAALATVLLLVGVAGLVVRDRSVAGRLRRWSGYAALVGLSMFALVFVVDAVSAGSLWSGTTDADSVLVLLVGLLVTLVGLGLALPAMVVMGVGYARTDRPTVGYALVAGPAASLVFFVVSLSVDLELVGALPLVVPVAATFGAIGHELWTRAEPLPEQDAGGGRKDDGDDGDGEGRGGAGDGRGGVDDGRDGADGGRGGSGEEPRTAGRGSDDGRGGDSQGDDTGGTGDDSRDDDGTGDDGTTKRT